MEDHPILPSLPQMDSSGLNLFQVAKAQQSLMKVILAVFIMQLLGIGLLVGSEALFSSAQLEEMSQAEVPEAVMLEAEMNSMKVKTVLMTYVVMVVWAMFAANRLKKSLNFGGLLSFVCTALLIVPTINLLVLMLINRHATNTLKGAGYFVKLMGVDDATLQLLESQYPKQ